MSLSSTGLRAKVDGTSVLRGITYVIGVVLTGYAVYFAYMQNMTRLRYANVFLGLCIALYYVSEIEGVLDRGSLSVLDVSNVVWMAVLSVLALLGVAHIEAHFDRLYYEAAFAGYTPTDYAVGILLIYVTTEITTREYGKFLGGFVLAIVIYGAFGPYFPGVLEHGGLSWLEAVRVGSIGFEGVYGFLLRIGATWVAIFIMLAGLAKAYGLMDFVMDAGKEVGKVFHSGIAHVAVFSSMGIGSIIGSGAANTATTGTFTIPLMKDQDIRSDIAGGIEVAASIGGQIMPPIMGIAAFIIAGVLAIPYIEVVRAGLIPAFLYYLGVLLAVHLLVIKRGWGTDTVHYSELEYDIFRGGLHYAVPVAVLIYTLVILRYSPLSAGFYTFVSLVATYALHALYTRGVDLPTVKSIVKKTLDGFYQGAADLAALIALLASIGFVLSIISRTGFAGKVNVMLIQTAEGNFVLILLAAMLLSLLFGLGMPAPAAYIVTASLAAVTIVEFGYPALIAHLFVFYFALFSSATPPVGPAAAIAAQIAQASYIKTGLQAMRITLPGYIIPFVFVFNQELVFWSSPDTAIKTALIVVGIVALTMATIGYNGKFSINTVHRLLLGAVAFVTFFAPYTVQVLAAAVIVFYFVSILASDRLEIGILDWS